MSAKTSIQWTDATANPWRGCSKVSPGCKNCYAENINNRFHAGENWGKSTPRPHVESFERQVLALNRRAERQGGKLKIFPSMIDWLDDDVPVLELANLLTTIRLCKHLDWQLLTKRPELFAKRVEAAADWCFDHGDRNVAGWLTDWYKHGIKHENVWVGVSVENQEMADLRIPLLRKIPACVKFLSCEPLLGPIDLVKAGMKLGLCSGVSEELDWVIVGGESGPGARPCDVKWITAIVEQCRNVVALFVKQLGSKPEVNGVDYRYAIKDSKGGEPDEWPDYLRVREFPYTELHTCKS